MHPEYRTGSWANLLQQASQKICVELDSIDKCAATQIILSSSYFFSWPQFDAGDSSLKLSEDALRTTETETEVDGAFALTLAFVFGVLANRQTGLKQVFGESYNVMPFFGVVHMWKSRAVVDFVPSELEGRFSSSNRSAWLLDHRVASLFPVLLLWRTITIILRNKGLFTLWARTESLQSLFHLFEGMCLFLGCVCCTIFLIRICNEREMNV